MVADVTLQISHGDFLMPSTVKRRRQERCHPPMPPWHGGSASLVPVRLVPLVTRVAPGAAAGYELDHITSRERRNDVKQSYWSADVDAPPASG